MGKLLKCYEISIEDTTSSSSLLSEAYVAAKQVRSLVLYMRNEKGQVVGGVTGGTYKNFARIQWLWANSLQDKLEIEHELLVRFEELAKARGCTFCFAEELETNNLPVFRSYGFTRIEGLPGFCRPDEPFGLIKHFDDLPQSEPANWESNITGH